MFLHAIESMVIHMIRRLVIAHVVSKERGCRVRPSALFLRHSDLVIVFASSMIKHVEKGVA